MPAIMKSFARSSVRASKIPALLRSKRPQFVDLHLRSIKQSHQERIVVPLAAVIR